MGVLRRVPRRGGRSLSRAYSGRPRRDRALHNLSRFSPIFATEPVGKYSAVRAESLTTAGAIQRPARGGRATRRPFHRQRFVRAAGARRRAASLVFGCFTGHRGLLTKRTLLPLRHRLWPGNCLHDVLFHYFHTRRGAERAGVVCGFTRELAQVSVFLHVTADGVCPLHAHDLKPELPAPEMIQHPQTAYDHDPRAPVEPVINARKIMKRLPRPVAGCVRGRVMQFRQQMRALKFRPRRVKRLIAVEVNESPRAGVSGACRCQAARRII